MSRAQPLSPDVRRAQILEAARRVFARLGYHRAAVSDIIAEAGVARGTFYNYFESKRAIFQAVLEDLMDEVASAAEPIDVHGAILPQVRGNLRRAIAAATDPTVSRLLFTEAAGIDDEGEAALREFYRAVHERLGKALGVGQRMGVVRQGDVTLFAQCLLGMVKHPVFIASLEGRAADPVALEEEIFQVLTAGMVG